MQALWPVLLWAVSKLLYALPPGSLLPIREQVLEWPMLLPPWPLPALLPLLLPVLSPAPSPVLLLVWLWVLSQVLLPLLLPVLCPLCFLLRVLHLLQLPMSLWVLPRGALQVL